MITIDKIEKSKNIHTELTGNIPNFLECTSKDYDNIKKLPESSVEDLVVILDMVVIINDDIGLTDGTFDVLYRPTN